MNQAYPGQELLQRWASVACLLVAASSSACCFRSVGEAEDGGTTTSGTTGTPPQAGGTSGTGGSSTGGGTASSGDTGGSGTTTGSAASGGGSTSGGTIIGGTSGGVCHPGDAGLSFQDAWYLTVNTVQRDRYVPMMSIAIADFNGDGHPDLLAGGVLLFGTGDGTFRTVPDPTPGSGGDYHSLVGWPADLNGDGLPDLVSTGAVIDSSGASHGMVLVFLNDRGVFPDQATFSEDLPLTTEVWIVAVGDLNGDGAPDLVLQDAPAGQSPLLVLLGNRDGTFRPSPLTAPSATACESRDTFAGQYGDVALGDVDGDGVPDIVQLCEQTEGPTFSVFRGIGDGTFAPPVQTAALANPSGQYEYRRTAYFALGDLDGDGHLDLVEGDVVAGQVGLFFGKGDGTFQAAQILVTGASPGPVAVADLNGDGKLDVVALDSDNGTAIFLAGRGDGTFDPQSWTAWSGGYYGTPPLAIADVNSDGRPDLLTGDRWGITELLTCPP